MKRVAIIGAGLAGTACAYILKARGVESVIYEAGREIAPGASGHPLGLYNPRISTQRSFYTDAFETALKTFKELQDIDWNQCGSLHFVTDEKKEKKYREAVKNWGWEDMEFLNAAAASEKAGVEIKYDALWLPRAGTVSPKKLCERYVRGVPIHFNAKVENIADIKADAVIVANGMGVKNLEETKGFPVKPVRGQVTYARVSEQSKNIKCNLCYGGYMTPAIKDEHVVGATFQRWLDHDKIIPKDNGDNLRALAAHVEGLGELKVVGQRAAVRTTTSNHFPIFGPVSGRPGLYVSTGHGSHGIITSIRAAHLIADDIMKRA